MGIAWDVDLKLSREYVYVECVCSGLVSSGIVPGSVPSFPFYSCKGRLRRYKREYHSPVCYSAGQDATVPGRGFTCTSLMRQNGTQIHAACAGQADVVDQDDEEGHS